tara:strand:+ start:2326 stop:2469 length:144 start_codon:yes stop_codon:yes gene_type:complete
MEDKCMDTYVEDRIVFIEEDNDGDNFAVSMDMAIMISIPETEVFLTV